MHYTEYSTEKPYSLRSECFKTYTTLNEPARTSVYRYDALNLRYPGQYFDRESGLHYNDRRYYDPSSGRYTKPNRHPARVTSAPVALELIARM